MKRVGEHEDVEQLGAGSRSESIEALPESAFELIRSHRPRLRRRTGKARTSRRPSWKPVGPSLYRHRRCLTKPLARATSCDSARDPRALLSG